MTLYRKHTFTLLEVVMAIAILAVGFVGLLGITVSAAKRMGKATSRWEHQHMLNQAAEYYLLAGPKEQIPEEFFSFEGYSAECIVEEAELPEDIEPEAGAWRFVKLKISIYDDKNNELDSLNIDQILRTEDVE